MPSPNNPVPIYTGAGVAVAYTGSGTIASPYANVLTLGTTYYAELGSEHWSSGGWQWVYDASIIVTSITIAATYLPREALATWGAAAGGWETVATLPVVSVAGGSAGNVTTPVTGAAAPRYRATIVVGAMGGSLVPYQNWKPA